MYHDVKNLLEGLASIVYGVLALVLLFALSWHQGSLVAMLLTVAAAGFTYVFQELQRHTDSPLLGFLSIVPPILGFLAFVIIGIGA